MRVRSAPATKIAPFVLSLQLLIGGAATALAEPASAPPPAPPASAGAAPKGDTATQGTSAVVMDLTAIESVIGKPVQNAGGEDLGHIVDVLVVPDGRVRAAVLDFGGVLGVGARKVAVAWQALNFSDVAKTGAVRIDMSRNEIRVAPEYKSGDPVVIIEGKPLGKAQPAPPPPASGADAPAKGSAPQR